MPSIDELVNDLTDKADDLQTVANIYDAALASEKAAQEEYERAWRLWQFPQKGEDGTYQNPPERLNEQLKKATDDLAEKRRNVQKWKDRLDAAAAAYFQAVAALNTAIVQLTTR
jgi:hypothetical protein